jgi:polysaccharide biosynthesis transport protein
VKESDADGFDRRPIDGTPPEPGLQDGFRRLLDTIRRRWLLVAMMVVVGAAGAYALSFSEEKQYESSASLLFRDRDLAQIFGDGGSAVPVDSARRAATNVDLVSSDEVAQRAWTALGMPSEQSEFRQKVRVSSSGKSDLVRITARDPDPDFAARIANAWAAEYIDFRRDADSSQIVETIALINDRLAGLTPEAVDGEEGRALRSRRDQLEIVASLQTGNAEIVEPARPGSSPVYPRPVRTAALAGVLSLILGLVLALLVERLDRRVRQPAQLQRLGVPILGHVPRSRALASGRRSDQPNGRLESSPAEREAFRLIRTNITFFEVNRRLDSLLVTSAVPGEGKTTVACNLAQAFADFGARTLLLEGDLRRPILARRLLLSSDRGLTNVLVSSITLDEAIQPLSVGTARGLEATGRLDVITSGPIPPNPQEMLESTRLKAVMEALRQRYDIIIIDCPPVVGMGDTISLSRLVAGLVVVSRLRWTTIDAVERLRTQFRLLGVRPLGIVVNGADQDAGYGDYSQKGSVSESDREARGGVQVR